MTPREAFANTITTWEGLYQADPKDAGNIRRKDGTVVGTMMGITPAVWARFKGVSPSIVTPEIMRGITLDDAVDVYEQFYYRGPGFERLHWCAATEVFCDIGWGSGPVVAIKMLQRMIGEHQDGVIGPRTVEAYDAWVTANGMPPVIHRIAEARVVFYRDLVVQRPANAKFLGGWLNRANWYRTTNARWWAGWQGDALPPSVEQAEATSKPTPLTPADSVRAEAGNQQIVQSATLAGGALAGAAGIFKWVPPWAVGVLIVAVVMVGSLWALRSMGIIKKVA